MHEPDAEFPEPHDLAADPSAALDRLVARLEREGPPRALLDALLLRARVDLGLPPIAGKSMSQLPEPSRTQYEDRYVEALRHVGGRLLDAGEVVEAWPYFRILGEKGRVASAIDALRPAADDPALSGLVEIAFNQGAHPVWGLERILEHYGICSAITAFEQLPTEETVRAAAADRLTRALHEQLAFSLRAEIERRSEPAEPAGASVVDLMAGRDWLFDDDAYHVDTSHLAAVARMAHLLREPDALTQARELTAYGERLSERYKYAGEPPFEDLYAGMGRYLDAQLGRNTEAAIAHFSSKLPAAADPDDPASLGPAQVLVRLLDRLSRAEEAAEVAIRHLAAVPEGMLICPTIAELCLKAGRADRLAEFARARGDAVQYAAAVLTSREAWA